MTIRFHCPNCGTALSVRDDRAGRPGKCHHCQSRIVAPKSTVAAQAAPPTVAETGNHILKPNRSGKSQFGGSVTGPRGWFERLKQQWRKNGLLGLFGQDPFEKGGSPDNADIWELLRQNANHRFYRTNNLKQPRVEKTRLVGCQWLAAKSLQELLTNLVIPAQYCFRCGASNPNTNTGVSVAQVSNLFYSNATLLQLDFQGAQTPTLLLPLCSQCASELPPNHQTAFGPPGSEIKPYILYLNDRYVWDIFYLSKADSHHSAGGAVYYLSCLHLRDPLLPSEINDFQRAFWQANWKMAVTPFRIVDGSSHTSWHWKLPKS